MKTIIAAVLAAWMAVPAGAALYDYESRVTGFYPYSYDDGQTDAEIGYGFYASVDPNAGLSFRPDRPAFVWDFIRIDALRKPGTWQYELPLYSTYELSGAPASLRLWTLTKRYYYVYPGGAADVLPTGRRFLGTSGYLIENYYFEAVGRVGDDFVPTPVPLPAAAPLLAGALGLLGLIRRRVRT